MRSAGSRSSGWIGSAWESSRATPRSAGCTASHWSSGDLAAVVTDMKGEKIGLGLVVLVGAGGEEHAERHVEATANLVQSLDLGPGDLIALLDAEEVRDSKGKGSGTSAMLGFTPLTGTRLSDQHAAFKDRLQPLRTERRVKVVSYTLEKQPI